MSNVDSWGMKATFTVKEYPSRNFFLAVEPHEGGLPILDWANGFLGLDLREGTTVEEAKAVAKYLNEKIDYVTFTGDKRREFAGTPGRSVHDN